MLLNAFALRANAWTGGQLLVRRYELSIPQQANPACMLACVLVIMSMQIKGCIMSILNSKLREDRRKG
jgi:hypothetical protein